MANLSGYNFAYLDEQTKRMIRRAKMCIRDSVKDANGNLLADGDSVTIIKDCLLYTSWRDWSGVKYCQPHYTVASRAVFPAKPARDFRHAGLGTAEERSVRGKPDIKKAADHQHAEHGS